MTVNQLIDKLVDNGRPIAITIFFASIIVLLLRSRVARRLLATIEETVLSNWRLALLGTTGVVLSLAAGWRTWEGMYNFTGEGLLAGMVTFGIQGIMLIVAWLIGESFATGMNAQVRPGRSRLVSAIVQPWLGSAIGLLLFATVFVLFLQWTGQSNVDLGHVENLSWTRSGDKFLIFGAGLLLVTLAALYAASDIVQPYLQVVRVIVRNSMLWLMFLACMATSVFFSFDSFFTSIFPQSERARAAEIRAQNQVSGILADIEQAIQRRRASLAEDLFRTDAWQDYARQLDNISNVSQQSDGAVERYVNSEIEKRRRAVTEQQERISSAEAGQAGLESRKRSLTDEKSRLASQRPELAAEFSSRKADYNAKLKEVDAKRVEALAEDKGVEGTGKAGRGPVYRQRMAEFALAEGAAQVAKERMDNAEKRLTDVESRLVAIDTELATVDGDLAKYKGQSDTAKQLIKLAESSPVINAKADPSRILPEFERLKSEFRTDPTVERLAAVQQTCNDIYGALAATPEAKPLIKGIDCDPKSTADAASALFALEAGTKVFNQRCLGGDKLVANKSTDDLFAFARKCLSDSALPSKDTEVLRTKINRAELSRDDKAHRFVVTLNAFQDGNRLAYLALAIAIGLDGLIFMSGLFGANAVRSPLSDIPSFKSRSGAQLEATINAALGANPLDAAWLTLSSLRPSSYQDGFTAVADLTDMERAQADRVRMVLTAGADIGAVEPILNSGREQYRVRSEFREYLSSVCDRQFKTDASAKERAHLDQLISAALAPHPREHAEIVLHSLEPIREAEGFTSMVTLSEIDSDTEKRRRLLAEYDERVVRRVINAGATMQAVAPDVDVRDRYYIRPVLYEALLMIRATAPESAGYGYDRARFEGVQARPAIEGGALKTNAPSLAREQRAPELSGPQPPALPRVVALSEDEKARLKSYYRDQLLSSIGLRADLVDERLGPESREAMEAAWKALDAHGKKNLLLGHVLRQFHNHRDQSLSEVYSRLVSEIDGDNRKRVLLDAVDGQIRDDLALYLLFPEMHLIDDLIEELENAAQPDDGLQQDEQLLMDQLKRARQALGELNLSNPRSWHEIHHRLAMRPGVDTPNFLNRPLQRRRDYFDDGDDV